MANKMQSQVKREFNKQVQAGHARLERHSGSGSNGHAKKNGCGGKFTWGSWEDAYENYESDLWEDELLHMLDDDAEPARERGTRQVVKCTEAHKARRVVGQRKARKVSCARPRYSYIRGAPGKNRRRGTAKAKSSNSKASTPTMVSMPQASFGAGFEPAVHLGTYEEMVTPSFFEQVQALVAKLSGPDSATSQDVHELRAKQLMPKAMAKKRFSHHPRSMTRNGLSVRQPMPATRCH